MHAHHTAAFSASTTGCESVGNSSVQNTKQSTDTQGHVCTCVVSWLVCELHMCVHVCTCKAGKEAKPWLSQQAKHVCMRTSISAVFLLCAVYYHAQMQADVACIMRAYPLKCCGAWSVNVAIVFMEDITTLRSATSFLAFSTQVCTEHETACSERWRLS